MTEPWGVDSEHGRLLDVLLCAPDNFRWLATSAISKATLDSGRRFDPDAAHAQHAELVSVYEQAGVRCHFLDPDPALPYQVFTRDSTAMTPWGAVVTQLNQWWRRGEYAAVIGFLQRSGVPIRGMVTAGALEGGDVMIVEPGAVLIGVGEERSQDVAARQLAGWYEEEGWEARIEHIPSRYVHIDVLCAILGEKLAAVCAEVLSASVLEWLRAKGFDLIEFSADDAFQVGGNAISLGNETILSSAAGASLNEALRARGLTVHDPDLSMFTLGGGGAHCLGQALRRERLATG
ncbi:MAG: dimethylarginine dimethylaminohydrolase family protein [Solirubrobacterales bacterium]